MDDVMRGYRDAIYYYYELLDRRNEDASYVLNYYQYSRFMDADYFYRPIFNAGGRWNLRIYVTYSNHKFYYYDAPRHYKTYRGEHGRRYYSKGYYSGRYKKQDRYTGRMRISGSRDFGRSLKNDFGVNVRDRGRDNRYNNYSNPNQSNRTQDERYRDVSGNRYSPEINNRNNGTRPNGNVNSNRGNSRQPQTSPQTSTRTGRGNRTESTTSSRRNDSSTRTESTTPSRRNDSSTRTESTTPSRRNDNGTCTESTRNSGGTVTRTGRR